LKESPKKAKITPPQVTETTELNTFAVMVLMRSRQDMTSQPMKMPRQKEPVRVSNMTRIISALSLMVFIFSTLTPSAAAQSDSFLSDLADFSKSLSSALHRKMQSGKDKVEESKDSQTLFANIYREILILKVVRKNYTSALKGYLKATELHKNILDREEAYAEVSESADRLKHEIVRLTYNLTYWGLQFDMKDTAVRQKLENYIDAKAQDLEALHTDRILGLTEAELSDAVSRAESTGKILDDALGTILEDIKTAYPSVSMTKTEPQG
jgi:hypothetical protein